MLALYYAIWILWIGRLGLGIRSSAKYGIWVTLEEICEGLGATYCLATGNLNLLVAIPVIGFFAGIVLTQIVVKEISYTITPTVVFISAIVTELFFLVFYAAIDFVGTHLPAVPV